MRQIHVEHHENADGYPHLAFYDGEADVSYVWGGGNYVQVCPNGYGEPVQDLVLVPERWSMESTTLAQFHQFVKEFVPFYRNARNEGWFQ